MSTFIFLSLALTSVAQQAPQLIQPQATEHSISESKIDNPQTTYYVYKDGQFTESALTKEPELIGGKELMETLIQLNIHYPDMAREKKIGGTVLVSVVIDPDGNIEDAFIHEGIGGGCNVEALRAVQLLDNTGFIPGEIRGKPVTVKFDIPITFLPK
jgi:protein TonB